MLSPVVLAFATQWAVKRVLLRFPDFVRLKRLFEVVILPAHGYWILWRSVGIVLMGSRPKIFRMKFPYSLLPDLVCTCSFEGRALSFLRKGFVYVFPVWGWLVTIILASEATQRFFPSEMWPRFVLMVLLGYGSLKMGLSFSVLKEVAVLIGTLILSVVALELLLKVFAEGFVIPRAMIALVTDAFILWAVSASVALAFMLGIACVMTKYAKRK